MLLFGALAALLRGFRKQGLSVIVMKGPALAELVYHNIALRPMIDLDILVRTDDLPAVEAILTRMDYVTSPHALPSIYYRRTHFHIPYYSRKCGILLEVHWRVAADVGVLQPEHKDIWRAAIHVTLAGEETLVMGCEDLLLYLCLHLDKHGYANRLLLNQPDTMQLILKGYGDNALIRFCDLWEVMQHFGDRIDWSQVVSRAKRWGIESATYTSLTLVERVFGQSPGRQALSLLRPPRVRWHERRLYQFALGLESRSEKDGKIFSWLRQRLLVTNTSLQFRLVKLIDLAGYIFPRRDDVARRYSVSGWVLTLHYVRHVIRAIARTGFGLGAFTYYSTVKKWSR